MPLFELPLETTNTSTLNGVDKGGVWILLFSEVTLWQCNVSTILSSVVDHNMFTLHRIALMKAGKSCWIHHLRLLFTHKNSDFGTFAKTDGNHTTTKPSQPMAPAQCSMCVNNLFQLCATAVHTKLDTKNYPLYSVNIALESFVQRTLLRASLSTTMRLSKRDCILRIL